jgi:hypothetical protein
MGLFYTNPAGSAQHYLDKIPQYTNQYMNPYIDKGNQAGDVLSQQYNSLATNPYGFYDTTYNNYNESPYAKYQKDQMTQAAQNTAAAGGYMGTQSDYQRQMDTSSALTDKYFQDYLNNIMGIYGTGLKGEQSLYDTGFRASTESLNDLIGYAGSSAKNQFEGANAGNQMTWSTLQGLAEAGGLAYGLGPMAMGVGAMSGGGIPGLSSFGNYGYSATPAPVYDAVPV